MVSAAFVTRLQFPNANLVSMPRIPAQSLRGFLRARSVLLAWHPQRFSGVKGFPEIHYEDSVLARDDGKFLLLLEDYRAEMNTHKCVEETH